jgi:putative hydrolase of the HAD superfamily
LDLDDAILDDSSLVRRAGAGQSADHGDRREPLGAASVVDAIRKTSKWFWDDPDRHREGRLELDAARREVVRLALLDLGVEDSDLAVCIGDAYSHRRDIGMSLLPDAIETVQWLRDSPLPSPHNGSAAAQRRRVRFGLADLSTSFSSRRWDSKA